MVSPIPARSKMMLETLCSQSTWQRSFQCYRRGGGQVWTPHTNGWFLHSKKRWHSMKKVQRCLQISWEKNTGKRGKCQKWHVGCKLSQRWRKKMEENRWTLSFSTSKRCSVFHQESTSSETIIIQTM